MLRFFDKDNRDITNELNIPDYCGNPSCLGEPWCSAWGNCSAEQSEGCDSAAIPIEGSGWQMEQADFLFAELSQLLAEEEVSIQG